MRLMLKRFRRIFDTLTTFFELEDYLLTNKDFTLKKFQFKNESVWIESAPFIQVLDLQKNAGPFPIFLGEGPR